MDHSPATETVNLSLRLLERLASSKESIGVSELAREFAASKATIYRHLQALVLHGFVHQDAKTLRYAAGIKLFILGERLRERFDFLPVAREDLARLRDETGQPATLSALVEEPGRGSRGPAGQCDRQFRNAARHGARPACERARQSRAGVRPARTHQAVPGEAAQGVDPAHDLLAGRACSALIAQVRTRGWATAPNRVLQGVNGLAAPVFNHAGDYVGAVAIAGSIQYIPASPPPEQIKAVTQAAARISRKLGWGGR